MRDTANDRSSGRKMHQTTVRFGTDLWDALSQEADRIGVSVAQYVRDAALGRLSYEAGRRTQQEDESRGRAEGVTMAQDRAQSEVSDSAAVLAQSQLARRRAGELRARSEDARARIAHHKT